MTAGSIVVAAGWAASTYFWYQQHKMLVGLDSHATGVFDPHYRLRMAAGLSLVVGLLLIGAAFWIVSTGTRKESKPAQVALPVP